MPAGSIGPINCDAAGGMSWTNGTNATTSDNAHAVSPGIAAGGSNAGLIATWTAGLFGSLPANATITKLTLGIECNETPDLTESLNVRLSAFLDGAHRTANEAAQLVTGIDQEYLFTFDATNYLPDADDFTGGAFASTLTITDSPSNGGTLNVDCMRIVLLEYTTPDALGSIIGGGTHGVIS